VWRDGTYHFASLGGAAGCEVRTHGRVSAVIIDPSPEMTCAPSMARKAGRLISVRAPYSAEAVISGHTATRFVVPTPNVMQHESGE
jgi:hypothetical protein